MVSTACKGGILLLSVMDEYCWSLNCCMPCHGLGLEYDHSMPVNDTIMFILFTYLLQKSTILIDHQQTQT